jgi:hypothetical protein
VVPLRDRAAGDGGNGNRGLSHRRGSQW